MVYGQEKHMDSGPCLETGVVIGHIETLVLLPETQSTILLVITRARQEARFLCHGQLCALKPAATSGAMADSDAQLFRSC